MGRLAGALARREGSLGPAQEGLCKLPRGRHGGPRPQEVEPQGSLVQPRLSPATLCPPPLAPFQSPSRAMLRGQKLSEPEA